MTLRILLAAILFFAVTTLKAQTELFKSQWAYTQNAIRMIDSSSNYVQKQRHCFRRKSSRVTYSAVSGKKIYRKIKVKYQGGNIIARECYKITSENKIRVLRINGQPVLVESVFKKKGFGSSIKNTFINDGGGTWQWIYCVYNAEKPTYKTETVYNWHP